MKVRMLTSMAGVNFAYQHGSVQDLPDALARRLIERKQAEPLVAVTGQPVAQGLETAAVVQPAVAAVRNRRQRGGAFGRVLS